MALSAEDEITKLKIKLQNLDRERDAINAQMAATRVELKKAQDAQKARCFGVITFHWLCD
jgi:predicted  nucleic acid-binding Zn-ribbon protein